MQDIQFGKLKMGIQHKISNVHKELRNQIYGCFAFSDSLEDTAKVIKNVTGLTVRDIREGTMSGKPCYILEYQKPIKKEVIYFSDSLTDRIKKAFNNQFKGSGIMFIYLDRLERLKHAKSL